MRFLALPMALACACVTPVAARQAARFAPAIAAALTPATSAKVKPVPIKATVGQRLDRTKLGAVIWQDTFDGAETLSLWDAKANPAGTWKNSYRWGWGYAGEGDRVLNDELEVLGHQPAIAHMTIHGPLTQPQGYGAQLNVRDLRRNWVCFGRLRDGHFIA